jgi:superfamily II DNA/RNA helicase
MFSATFPVEVQKLAGKFLNDYLFLTVGIVGGACSDVEQKFYEVGKFDKRKKLVEMLGQSSGIVFFLLYLINLANYFRTCNHAKDSYSGLSPRIIMCVTYIKFIVICET